MFNLPYNTNRNAMILKSINPFTNETIREFEEYTEEKVENLLLESKSAFEKWKKTNFEYRSFLMTKVAGSLRFNLNEFAEAITSEMGKPVKESRAELEKCA